MNGDLIRQWAASPNAAEQIAAGLARKIASGQLTQWDEFPPNRETADDYGVSPRTVIRARKLLADETDGQPGNSGAYMSSRSPLRRPSPESPGSTGNPSRRETPLCPPPPPHPR